MRRRLKKYLEYLAGIDFEKLSGTELLRIKNDLLIQTGFFQHERLIHLIVTVFFALFTIIAIALTVFTGEMAAAVLSGIFFVLLVPYVAHYYFLENGVQKLYEYYDRILKEEIK